MNRRISRFITIGFLFIAVSGPAAFAQEAEMDFQVGIPGKTGCLVCHGDKNLYKLEEDGIRSLYVDEADFGTVHIDVTCIECHTDFTYQTIKPATEEWRTIAGLACKDCHDEQKEIDHRKTYEEYRESVHGQKLLAEADPDAPSCAGCHGSHRILSPTKDPDKASLRADAYTMCGRCHEEDWDSYNDWFHGKAYKHGAPDAPPCWDCHTGHRVLASTETASPTNPVNLAEQCALCHKGSDAAFAAYGPWVHGRNTAIEENFVMKYILVGYRFIRTIVKDVTGTLSRSS